MKKKGSSKIKLTVIIGYVLVMGVMAFGLTALYKNLVDYSDKKIKSEDLSELLMVSNTLSLLYEIESEQNLLTTESAETYLQKYDSIVPIIKTNLDELKEVAGDTARVIKLDSIEWLVEMKKENLLVMAALIDSLRQSPRILRQTESNYVPLELNREIKDYLQSRNLSSSGENKSDTSVVVGDRKRFFDRMRDAITGRPDSTIVIESTSVLADREFMLVVDTIINKVRYSEKLDLQRQRKFQEAFLARQEMISFTNRMLTARIDDLLKEIEQEEMMKSVQLLVDKKEALSRSENTMRTVSLMAIAIALVFGVLFLLDINKSQRYRRRLEASNRRITDLLASRERMMLTISHDIKAPMSSILGYLELLIDRVAEKKESAVGYEYLANMQRSGEHVLQLVTSLLDYHKLESGVWKMRRMNVDLKQLVTETAVSFEPMATQKNLDFKIENELPEALVCHLDPYIVRQIMGNLISNAVKYTYQGSITAAARVEEVEGGAYLFFSVTDTGIGIDLDEQAAVFQDFKQLDSASDQIERTEGSGLGLAITKGFVEQMGGNIRLLSEKGAGSQFIVELPLEMARGLDAAASSEELKTMSGLTVLVVDDDVVQLKMTAEMLKKANVKVVTENQPEHVHQLLEEQHFDLMLVDLQMPGLDGFMLVDEIRESANDYQQKLPIIALSARPDTTEESLKEAGFNGFLTKPFSFDQLCNTVLIHTVEDEGNTNQLPKHEDPVKATGVRALIDFVKEDEEASLRILKSFVEETALHIASLKDAGVKNDTNAAGKVAHTILPLVRMMGEASMVFRLECLEKHESLPSEEMEMLLRYLGNQVESADRLVRDIEDGNNVNPGLE